MFTRPLQPLVIWVLLAAQAAAALASPAGIFACREADGTSHIEWRFQACCVDPHTEAGAIEDAAAADHEAAECSEGSCSDMPIEAEEANLKSRPRDRGHDGADLSAPPAIVSTILADPAAEQCRSRTSGSDPGPPRAILRALRATVLLL